MVDISQGLTAVSTALTIAKQLRDIDRSVDEATFKMAIADLTEALADAKVAIAEAKSENSELRSDLDELRNGKLCPKCRAGKMTLIETRGQTQRGLQHFGVELWKYRCCDDSCGFERTETLDPHGAIQIAARKA